MSKSILLVAVMVGLFIPYVQRLGTLVMRYKPNRPAEMTQNTKHDCIAFENATQLVFFVNRQTS